MINLIPGGFFEHAEDSLMPENPGFFRTPFKAPSPTGGGGGGIQVWGGMGSPGGNGMISRCDIIRKVSHNIRSCCNNKNIPTQ